MTASDSFNIKVQFADIRKSTMTVLNDDPTSNSSSIFIHIYI